MDRRIAPPRDMESLLDELTGQTYNLFDTKQKALMFAAALGKHIGRRTEIDRKGTGIRWDIFENANDDGFINALAIAEKGELQILAPERVDERARIFEEYAHTGLKEIKRRCFDSPGAPLQILIQMTDDAREPPSEEVSGVDPELLRGLLG